METKGKYITKIKLLFVAAIVAQSAQALSGCGSNKEPLAKTNRTPYEKLAYRTVTVQKGSITPHTTITLKAQGYQKNTYGAKNQSLALQSVNVSVGDRVKKGDVLVSFKSDELQHKIEEYSDQISQNELLIEHYEALMKADKSQDYSKDVAALKSDNEVVQLYLEETKEKLNGYQIVAAADGTISFMNSSLQAGVYTPGNELVTEISGNGRYEADRPEGYDFIEGQECSATADGIAFTLKICEVTDDKLVFEPVSDMSAVSDAQLLSMEVTRPEIEDALYVPKDAVHEVDGCYFVYKLDKNGYRQAVSVTVGDTVDKYRLITDGLSVGEEVVI